MMTEELMGKRSFKKYFLKLRLELLKHLPGLILGGKLFHLSTIV